MAVYDNRERGQDPDEKHGELKIGNGSNMTGLLYSTDGWIHFHAKGPSSVCGALIGATVKVCEDAVVTVNPEIGVLFPFEW